MAHYYSMYGTDRSTAAVPYLIMRASTSNQGICADWHVRPVEQIISVEAGINIRRLSHASSILAQSTLEDDYANN